MKTTVQNTTVVTTVDFDAVAKLGHLVADLKAKALKFKAQYEAAQDEDLKAVIKFALDRAEADVKQAEDIYAQAEADAKKAEEMKAAAAAEPVSTDEAVRELAAEVRELRKAKEQPAVKAVVQPAAQPEAQPVVQPAAQPVVEPIAQKLHDVAPTMPEAKVEVKAESKSWKMPEVPGWVKDAGKTMLTGILLGSAGVLGAKVGNMKVAGIDRLAGRFNGGSSNDNQNRSSNGEYRSSSDNRSSNGSESGNHNRNSQERHDAQVGRTHQVSAESRERMAEGGRRGGSN